MGGKQQQGGKKASANAGNEDDVRREQKLQAVLLADSFNRTFRPITLESPKVLLPLVNVPMLDYTIEFLAQNGVEEIIVFCAWHADMIENYISKSKWPSLISIKCVTDSSCASAGDALRELDKMNIVRSDPFILVSGDIVSNMNLKKAIDYHKLKRKVDNNNIMTVVLKKIQKFSSSKPILDDLTVGLNRKNSQILLFEDLIQKNEINISTDLMGNYNANELTFYTDLLDCNIDICSQELLLQFSDNFDYQDIRKDFIKNEVSNYTLGKSIYSYIIENEYAARVKDPRTYHSISRDIVTRWVYPLVPDIPLLEEGSTYIQSKRYVYKEQGVKVSRSAVIGEEVVIGKGTQIGSGSGVTKSIVGRNVNIQDNSIVVESHIWNNVMIESDVMISHAIICDNAIIHKGAKILRGAVISYGVEIGENVIVPEFTRVTKSLLEADHTSSIPSIPDKIWQPDKSFYDSNNDFIGSDLLNLDEKRAFTMCSIGSIEEDAWKKYLWSKMPEPVEEEDEDCFDEDIFDDLRPDTSREEKGAESHSDDDLSHGDDDDDDDVVIRDNNFCRNVMEMVVTASTEGHPADSILMEIKALKFAHNKDFGDCLQGIVNAMFVIILEKANQPGTILGLLKSYSKKNALVYTLIKKMTQNVNNEVEIISFIEDYLQQSNILQPLFRFILQTLHDAGSDDASNDGEDNEEEAGLLSTKGILKWAEKRRQLPAYHPRAKFVNDPKVQQFLEWLEEEEEEDEDDSEDDDDEEEDDED